MPLYLLRPGCWFKYPGDIAWYELVRIYDRQSGSGRLLGCNERFLLNAEQNVEICEQQAAGVSSRANV